MARKNREWYPNTCYHITCRGNHRNNLFRDEADFGMYLGLIKLSLEHFKQTPYELLCYCFMDNHLHLLIQTTSTPLGPFMKKINMNYAIYFNQKYNYIGHLFQDRFFSEIINDEVQLLETSRYIHLNPVKAKIVELPEDYIYSSYRFFINLAECELVNKEKILSLFKKDDAPILYKHFVENKNKLQKEAL